METFPAKVESLLELKVYAAKQHALTEQEFDEVSQKEFEMQSIQNKRELTDEEVRYYYDFREKMNGATIEVTTLPEARRAMEILGFKPEQIVDVLSHENAHGNKAEELEAKHLGYKFVVIKSEDGYVIQPQANIYIPDEWPKERQNEALIKITAAPEEYGDELSDGDRRDLEDLR